MNSNRSTSILSLKCALELSILSLVGGTASAAVTGTVFKDFNGNGVRDNTATFNEIGMPGVVVKAFASDGSSVAVAYTNGTSTGSDGAYSVPSATPGQVRLEFLMPDSYTYASNGAIGGTTVMFPSTATQDLAVNYPNDYSQASPQLIVPCYVGGTLNGGGATLPALVRFNYFGMDKYIGQAGYVGPTYITDHQQLGAVFGVAYSRQTKKAFVGAVLRRHVVFGPLGVGGLYQVDPITGVATNWLDIETLAGIDAGIDPRDGTPANSIPADPDGKSYDYNAFALIGKMSLGDVEISEDGSVLYVVNLFQQSLVAINTSTKALIGSYPITASSLGLTCPQSDFRPWGLKYYKGKVYVGAVCSAQSTQSASNLSAYVLSFDPANPSAGFSNFYSFSLGYTRETSNGPWKPWNETSFDPGSSATDDDYNPQPIFSNLEFDVDGSLIMALLDRHAIMFSSANGPPDPTASSSASTTPFSAGDTLRACLTSSGYALEGTSGCPFPLGTTEFYDDRRQGGQGNGNIKESAGGALALYAGSGEIASTAIDEFNVNENGIGWWNNATGVRNRAYMIFDKNVVGAQGKTSGLGDIELLADAAPISVGNRVWADSNSNGIQDADEPVISGVTVKLKDSGNTTLATAVTDSAGSYYFSSAAGTSTVSAIYGVSGLTYNTTGYRVCIATSDAALGGKSATVANSDPSANGDERDSDGVINGSNVEVTLTVGAPGQNNYSLDFGFTSSPVCPTINVTPSPLASGSVGTAYTGAPSASGGTTPYTWTATSLPTGLSINASTGEITGTPTATGTATITAKDTNFCSGTTTLVINAFSCPVITVTPATLPSAQIGTVYNQTPVASGAPSGSAYIWSATSLPAGLTINATTGGITGTPTATGTASITATYTSAGTNCTGTTTLSVGSCPVYPAQTASITIDCNVSVSKQVTSTGGTAPYTFTVTTGTLPAGLSLSSTGLLTGTTTATGPVNVTITSLDSAGCPSLFNLTINITPCACPTITVTPGPLASGTVGTAYSASPSASGGATPYVWTATSLPAGLTINASTGAITGTPTATGNATITATDANGCTGTTTLVINPFACPVITVNPTLLPPGSVGQAYSQTPSASGAGAGASYAWSATALPGGLTLNPATGAITGTPTAEGNATITATYTGPGGEACTGTTTLAVTNNCCPQITISVP